MRLKSTADSYCSIARSLDVVGEWWTLLIVRDLLTGVRRFDQLQANLGIARNVLTSRLARLMENGIVETQLYQERPPRYEYVLTEKGRQLAPVLYSLLEWGDTWMRDENDPPPVKLQHAACGHKLTPVLVCPECDALVDEDERELVSDPALVPARPGAGRDSSTPD